jgi:hypothetical protein
VPLGLRLNPERFRRLQCIACVGLTLASLAGQIVRFVFHHDKLFGLIRQFDLDNERNIPTWYQSVTLAWCAVLIACVGQARKQRGAQDVRQWRVLAIGFALMSLDEAASFHESARLPAQLLKNIPGYLSFSWVVPGTLVVLLVCRYFWRWVTSLPSPLRRRVAVAGAIYVGGALGFEAIGGIESITIGLQNFVYVLTYTTEEFLEMLGVALMTYAMLDYLRREHDGAVVKLGEATPGPVSPS